MKIKKISAIMLFSVLLPGSALGTSVIYNGFECLNAVDATDPTPVSSIPIQSRFEVIEDVGDGIFRLSLTGGLPRFTNNNQNVCIDKITAIGFSGIPQIDGIPQLLESIDATAYFSSPHLIIVINSINTDLNATRSTFSSFSTSSIRPISNTLILEHNPQSSSFSLKKLIHNRGYTHTSGSTNSLPFFETILPSFNEAAQDKPRILTPVSNIEYTLQ